VTGLAQTERCVAIGLHQTSDAQMVYYGDVYRGVLATLTDARDRLIDVPAAVMPPGARPSPPNDAQPT
jgi:hypothetical protein